jgi:hypothetical protein
MTTSSRCLVISEKDGIWCIRKTLVHELPIDLTIKLPKAQKKVFRSRSMANGCWELIPQGADAGVLSIGSSKAQAFEQAALALTARASGFAAARYAGLPKKRREAIRT